MRHLSKVTIYVIAAFIFAAGYSRAYENSCSEAALEKYSSAECQDFPREEECKLFCDEMSNAKCREGTKANVDQMACENSDTITCCCKVSCGDEFVEPIRPQPQNEESYATAELEPPTDGNYPEINGTTTELCVNGSKAFVEVELEELCEKSSTIEMDRLQCEQLYRCDKNILCIGSLCTGCIKSICNATEVTPTKKWCKTVQFGMSEIAELQCSQVCHNFSTIMCDNAYVTSQPSVDKCSQDSCQCCCETICDASHSCQCSAAVEDCGKDGMAISYDDQNDESRSKRQDDGDLTKDFIDEVKQDPDRLIETQNPNNQLTEGKLTVLPNLDPNDRWCIAMEQDRSEDACMDICANFSRSMCVAPSSESLQAFLTTACVQKDKVEDCEGDGMAASYDDGTEASLLREQRDLHESSCKCCCQFTCEHPKQCTCPEATTEEDCEKDGMAKSYQGDEENYNDNEI